LENRINLAIDIKKLDVRYPNADGLFALNDITFQVQQGERCALLGANGAGKSTMLYVLAGLLAIESGSASLNGAAVEPKNFRDLRKMIGFVFQNPDEQLFMPKVYDDIAFGLRNNGCSEEKVREEVYKTAEKLNIAHLLSKHPSRLSGGEKRLAALAGVLTMSPDILLLDEPTSFLDPVARKRIIKILAQLPHTELIASHDLEMAGELCNRAIILKSGRIFFCGGVEMLKDNCFLIEAGLA
jgi:cobalt/nickel transport system ATP-binding protein